jgi:hypothetical protein
MMKWARILLFAIGFTALAGGCGRATGGGDGSETHWLAACQATSDCEQGECLCGVCTVSCDSFRDCPAPLNVCLAQTPDGAACVERICGSVDGPGGGGSPCADATAPTLVVDGEGAPATPASSGWPLIDVSAGALLAVFTDDDASASGSILRVDLRNGATRVLASGRASPYAVSASGGFAYWLDNGTPDTPTGLALMRAPLDGSAGAEMVKVVTFGPTDTLGVGDTLYFGDNGALASLASGATAPTDLVPDGAPLILAAAGGNVYCTQCRLGVYRIPAGGGARQHVADATCAYGLATDGVEVFFIEYVNNYTSRGLFHAPADGGTAALVEGALVPSLMDHLAVDADNVYYATADGLYRTGRSSGVTERVAAGEVTDIAVDDTCVYWGDAATQAVFTLRK